MAPFNEDIKFQEGPNWLGWSKNPGPIQPDTSGAILGHTIGKVAEGAVNVAADITEQYAKSSAEDILNKHISDLEGVNNLLKDGEAKTPGGAAVAGAALPPQVTDAISKAETLSSANRQGKISDTYFDGMINALSSKMNAAQPWFSKQIQSGIAKATGNSHTANEYATALRRDINATLGAKDSAKTSVLNHLASLANEGYVGIGAVYRRVQSGDMTPDQGLDWVSMQTHHKLVYKQAEEAFTLDDKADAFSKRQAEKSALTMASKMVGEVTANVASELGLKSNEELIDAMNHPEKFKEHQETFNQMAMHYGSIKATIQRKLFDQFNEVPNIEVTDSSGRTYKTKIDPKTNRPWLTMAQKLGDAKTKEIINNATAPIDINIAQLKDGQIGSLAYWSNHTKALQDNVNLQFSESELGIPTRVFNAAKHAGVPDTWSNQLSNEFLAGGGNAKIKAVAETMMLKGTLTTEQAKAAGAEPSTMVEDLDRLKSNNMNDIAIINKFAKYTGSIVDSNAPDSVKAAAIRYNFDPANSRLLSQWTYDGLDPMSNTYVRNAAQSNVFAMMTSKNITDTVRKLDQGAYHGIWNTYKTTTSQMTDTLVGTYIRDLARMTEGGGIPPGLVSYNDQTNQFDINKSLMFSQPNAAHTYPSIKQMIDRLNTVTPRMADIARAEGSDPNAYILKVFEKNGYEINDKTAKTFPDAMINAVLAHKASEKAKMEDARNRLRDLMNAEKNRPSSKPTPTVRNPL